MADVSKFGGADYSMHLYKLVGTKLISAETALEIAKRVVRDNFGKEELDLQSPFAIREQGRELAHDREQTSECGSQVVSQ
jgi:hypothetical protein